ncbi:hypothetical protein V1264_010430 [Littorina saxatilis]|uniref:Uncharacterized protein n=1 Tax=Littorina saxatilis TaxID=31220 RepID=A0AAN9APD7_9CAEN
MPPRRKLSDLDRGRAIGWLQDGVAARQVAQRLAVAPSVIIRLKQRFHATGRVQERQRSGRPRSRHHTKRGSLHSEAGHATKNGYGKQH